MNRAAISCVLLATSAVALGACGSSSDSPRDLVNNAGKALGGAKGFKVQGTTTDRDGSGDLSGSVDANGNVSIEGRLQAGKIDVITQKGTFYFKGDTTFWTKQGGAKLAKIAAGKWLSGSSKQFGGTDFEKFAPQNISRCVTENLGTLSKAGSGTVDGKKVTIVKDAGDKPGSQPQKISIASSGKAYPLRVEQTGPRKPGGKLDPVCGDKNDTTTSSSITFSSFGNPGPISAPPNAITLQQLQQQAVAQAKASTSR